MRPSPRPLQRASSKTRLVSVLLLLRFAEFILSSVMFSCLFSVTSSVFFFRLSVDCVSVVLFFDFPRFLFFCVMLQSVDTYSPSCVPSGSVRECFRGLPQR